MNKTLFHCLIVMMTLALTACGSTTLPPLSPTAPPSETPLPATATETSTPEATATPKSSLKLSDPVGGFELTLPPGWAGVFTDAGSIGRANTENPSLGKTLEYIHQTGMGMDRAYLYDADPAGVTDGFVSHALVYFLKNGLVAFVPMETIIQQAGEQLRGLDPTLTITSASTVTTAAGMEVGILEATEAYRTPAGGTLNLHDKIAIFKTNSGAAIIFLRVHPDMKALVVPLFDRMIEEVRLF